MRQKKLQYLTIIQFTYIVYFLFTTAMFFLAIKQGNEGITFRLFGGGDDGMFYWQQAQNVSSGDEWVRTSIYPFIIGKLMAFTGIHDVYLIRFFNYIGFILLSLSLLKLIKAQINYENELGKEDAYRANVLILLALLFYPSLLMNVNMSIIRDVWIYLFYVLSVGISVKLFFGHKNKVLYGLLLILSIIALGQFRKYALLSFAISLALCYTYLKVKLMKNPYRFVIICIGVFAIYYTLFIDYTLPIVNMTLRQALNYRMSGIELLSAGSNMRIHLDQPNAVMFMVNYVYSYIGNLIGPLPWHISGISTGVVFIFETIPMCLILRFLYKKRKLLTRVQGYILLHSFVWISLIAVTNDNIGTASRLRPVAWLLILNVFVVVYMKYKSLKHHRKGEVTLNDKDIIY